MTDAFTNPLLRVSEQQMALDNASAQATVNTPMSDNSRFRFDDGSTLNNPLNFQGAQNVATSTLGPVVQPPSANIDTLFSQNYTVDPRLSGGLSDQQLKAQLTSDLAIQESFGNIPTDARRTTNANVPDLNQFGSLAVPLQNIAAGNSNVDAIAATDPLPGLGTGGSPDINNDSLFNILPSTQQVAANSGVSPNLDLEQNVANSENNASNPFTLKDGFDLGFSGLKALSGLFNAYQGYKALGIAEDQFDFNKSVTRTNLANQANLTNEALADRQRRRFAQGSSQTTAADYVSKYGASGTA